MTTAITLEPTPTATAAGAPLHLDGVTKRYGGDRPALDGLSVTIEAGTTLCVLGPSGCGKSTLLRLVAGLETPDLGTVAVGGRSLSGPGWATTPERRGINMVFQDYALWPHLTVDEIIGYGLRFGANRAPRPVRRRRVAELVELLRLGGLERRRPGELSGGQQQRVAIARALATAPGLLLFDEPLSNLDAQLRTAMREELSTLLASLDTTAVYVTHDVAEALALADRVLVLHEGRTIQLGSPQEVFSAPRSGWVAGLAGFSSVLRLDSVEPAGPGVLAASTPGGRIVGRDCGVDSADPAGGPVAYVHPDACRVTDTADSITGRVVASVFEGRSYRTRVELVGAGSLVAATGDRLGPGSLVGVHVDPDGVLVFRGGDR